MVAAPPLPSQVHAPAPDSRPGVTVSALRTLPCGCIYQRSVTFAEPLAPGWLMDAARTLGASMRLFPLAHKCPKEAAHELP